MTGDDRIYDLLPAFHRIRDAEQGYPLRAVLRIISGQMSDLEANIAQLYADWFIETCQDWVVPYLGDLVGVTLGGGPIVSDGSTLDPIAASSRRRQVANALTDRRAKGTVAVLERLAADTTGWPARAIELGPLLAITQSAHHPDPSRGRLIDTHDEERLETLGTPFDCEATVVDTRTTSASRLLEIRNLPAVAVAVWRLLNDNTARAPAMCVNDDNHYTFDALGRDLQLCVSPLPRAPGTRPASDLDVPVPITRLGLERRIEDYYGPNRSLCVYRRSGPVHRSEIVAANLSGWRYRAHPGQVAIDPALGRIAFAPRHAPEDGVWVRYSRLMVGDIGGGHYARALTPLVVPQVPASPPGPPQSGASASARPAVTVYRVAAADGRGLTGVSEALRAWETDRAAGRAGPCAVIEITDDEVYEERLRIELQPGQHLEIRAADGCRPVLRPVDRQRNRSQSLLISGVSGSKDMTEAASQRSRNAPASAEKSSGDKVGAAESRGASGAHDTETAAEQWPSVILDGVWVAGHSVELVGELGTVAVRHCTLVPGREDPQPDPRGRDVPPGLVVHAAQADLVVDRSVIGRVLVESPETGFDPLTMTVADSIIDATDLAGNAIAGPDGDPAYVVLALKRVTVLGGASVHQVGLIEDSILTGRLRAYRRQVGAVRFSYIPPGSATPRRTSCQPDGVRLAAGNAASRALAAARVTPRFDDVRLTAPAYARLVDGTAAEIATGASDEGEMGAYHDLWLGLRTGNLKARIQEFTPVGADIGVLFAS